MNINYRNIDLSDIDPVLEFTDKWIGKGYFKKDELRTLLLMGVKDNLNASFMALDGDKIVAVRITLAPYQWTDLPDIHPYLTTHMWRVTYKRAGYFKSLFVDQEYQKKGIGTELTKRSMEVLMKMGCMAIVCHSWLESPSDSSRKYLRRLKFESVAKHRNFWFLKDYECIKCSPSACSCTAEEMIYYFPLEEDDDE